MQANILTAGLVIMILRVYALYASSFRILLALGVVFVGQIIAQAIANTQGVRKYRAAHLHPPLTVALSGAQTPLECILLFPDGLAIAVWAPWIVTESLIFVCTLWRMKRYCHGEKNYTP